MPELFITGALPPDEPSVVIDTDLRIFAAVVLLLPLFIFFTFQHTYFAWGDEVQFVDPAASAYFGQGFTSMEWPFQSSEEFFAGNAPGYSLLLIPWFWLWGFGLEQARWLNFLLAVTAAFLMLKALGRIAPGMPLWLKALALSGSFLGVGVLVSAGSARYDILCLVVAAWVFLCLSRTSGEGQRLPLLLAGMASFYAGFHLVAALVIVMLLLLAQSGRRHLGSAISLGAGIVFGLMSWLGVLALHGLFVKFLIMLFGSQHTISGQMGKLVLQGDDRGVLDKVDAFRLLITTDLSLSLVALLLTVMLVTQWRHGSVQHAPALAVGDRLIGWLAIDFAFVLPIALLLLGKFPIYYSWMAYVPATLVAAAWAWRCFERGRRWPLAAFVLIAVGASGLGVYSRAIHRDVDPGSGLYADFNTWVRRSLTPEDTVYADPEAYFAARAVAHRVLGPTYAQTVVVRGIPERERVTALLVQVPHRDEVALLIGGEWREQARFVQPANSPASRRLEFILLRRAKTSPS